MNPEERSQLLKRAINIVDKEISDDTQIKSIKLIYEKH